MDKYFKKQILTYMGNKRKLLPHIEEILKDIQKKENKEKLILGDGFSGSGIVSRLFKNYASKIYTNDLAGYSKTLNECYLANPTEEEKCEIQKYIDMANEFADSNGNEEDKFIQVHWAPSKKKIERNERVYYTYENGKRIDRYMYFIRTKVPQEYRKYLLAVLLVESSMHTNTSGHFAAFYKKDEIGHYGGKNEIDLKRITQKIELNLPLFSLQQCNLNVAQQDTNIWIRNKEPMDMVYYDPPYNKHPYNIYYFLLDIINNWDIDQEIPDTMRGQPKNWKQSAYNSTSNAKKMFEDLIENTKAKYILISYNNAGIISEKDMENILSKKGNLERIYIEHKTYNRMRGIANYKREKETSKIKECLWLVTI